MSDLRDSALEQDRPNSLCCRRITTGRLRPANIMDVIVGKNRHGPTGTVSLYFRKELTRR